MKVADYILDYLVLQKVKHVFLMVGGAIAFAVDAFSKRHDIEYICVAHEQAGAMMAESYARVGPGLGVAMTTSGPGATNLITGICCAWFDSIATLFISGQVNTYEQKSISKVRQVGFQETEIVDIVRPITKFAVKIDRAEDTRFLLEKAVYIAKTGRPGPVLIDIPLDLQKTEIKSSTLKKFIPPKEKQYKDTGLILKTKIEKVLTLIAQSKRPLILAGSGIRLAGAVNEIHQMVKLTGIPVVNSWSGYDLFAHNHSLFIGTHGVYGERGANFAVQNCDLLISIGSRLDTRQTGGKPETYARAAKIVMIDIDQTELDKRRGLTPAVSIQADAKEFLRAFIKEFPAINKSRTVEWIKHCATWREKYPTVLLQYYEEKKYVNPYVFAQVLSKELKNDAIVIPDTGATLTWIMQGFELKQGQRLFSAFGNSPMGYSFPAAIGASFARGKKEIICINGDGGFQINIQELQTLVYHKLPVKIFILNNHGYGIIKQFQEMYLDSRFEATGKGYSCPDFIKIAQAYGIKSVSIRSHTHLSKKIKEVLSHRGPVLCDVYLNDDQKIIPKLSFGSPIEDLFPLLPRDEFRRNMIIPPIKTKKEASI